MTYFAYPFIHGWAFGLSPPFSFCEECYCVHICMYLRGSLLPILWIYVQNEFSIRSVPWQHWEISMGRGDKNWSRKARYLSKNYGWEVTIKQEVETRATRVKMEMWSWNQRRWALQWNRSAKTHPVLLTDQVRGGLNMDHSLHTALWRSAEATQCGRNLRG